MNCDVADPNGASLVSDDQNCVICRITYFRPLDEGVTADTTG